MTSYTLHDRNKGYGFLPASGTLAEIRAAIAHRSDLRAAVYSYSEGPQLEIRRYYDGYHGLTMVRVATYV